MRGSLRQRYKGSWSIILELDRARDPVTKKVRRRQQWITFRGTRRQAETKLNELLSAQHSGTFVESSKVTLGEWLTTWLDASVRPRCRTATYTRYKGIIDNSLLKATIANLPLQRLRPSHIEAYYADVMDAAKRPGGNRKKRAISASTLTLHHAILHRALRKAAKDKLIPINVAADLDGKPRREREPEDARQHAWSATEAQAFLVAAKAAGSQPAAFYSLALDTGMRKGELCGLRWSDVNLETGKIRVEQQLLTTGAMPEFGPTKTGRARTVSVGVETLELLRAHKRNQAALKMKNRSAYHDHGLTFAKEWHDVRQRSETLGQPLQANNIGQREYSKLIKAAGVRPIKFHGLRHTCATLLLQAGEPVHVVAQRLGHSKVEMTLNIYAHVLPDMQQTAAAKLGALLHR